MSTNEKLRRDEREWWERLGLTGVGSGPSSANDRRRDELRSAVLSRHVPSSFTVATDDGLTVQRSIDELVDELHRAEREVEEALEEADRTRKQQAREATASAYAAPDADEPVTEGEWAGFTRARAIAWCWNLYQYEPHGFVSPGSTLRARRVRELEAGGIPDGFGYAERARRYEAAGVNADRYREVREALGSPTFSPEDVRFGSG